MTERLTELIKKYQFFGLPLISVVIAGLLLIFVIFPQLITFFKTQGVISQTRQRAQALEAKATTLEAINTGDYQKNLDLVLSVLPANKDIPATIGQVQTLVTTSGLQLSSINFSTTGGAAAADTGDASGAQSFQVKVDVTGNSQALKAFFTKLKDGTQVMKLNGLEVSTAKGGATQATLTILSYFQSPPSFLGDEEKPVTGLDAKEIDLLAKIQQQVTTQPINSASAVLPPRGKDNPFQ
jgi:hypothetical protein